jgi:nickel-dependent lactate racemase
MKIPYGSSMLEFTFSGGKISEFLPGITQSTITDEKLLIRNALYQDFGSKNTNITPETTIGIGINDQSRPIPHHILLPELINFLLELGAKKENITFYIATGTHKPVTEDLFSLIVDETIIQNYKIVSHDCDDRQNLVEIGVTTRNTPVFINKDYYESDLKIVVGNIESHHFMGFSGGYKTASIGLTSRETITGNHNLLPDPNAKMGLFSSNPMRLEVEEIGKKIGVDLALNVVIGTDKKILDCFWGPPEEVVRNGICYIRDHIQLDLGDVLHQFDLVIASAGGYPKDINFYQSQKALTHACLFAKPGGKIILIAECRDGFGSDKFENFISSRSTPEEVIKDFESKDFEIGPHKAYQLANQVMEHEIYLISSMNPEGVRSLKLKHRTDIQSAINEVLDEFPKDVKIAVLPYATHTMPKIRE